LLYPKTPTVPAPKCTDAAAISSGAGTRAMRDENGKTVAAPAVSYGEWRRNLNVVERSEKNFEFSIGSPVTNLKYVNSTSFKRKFSRISDDQELNQLIYARAKAAVIHQSGDYYEDLSLVSIVGKKVVGSTSGIIRNETYYSQKLKDAIKEHPPYTLVSIHNHGTNIPPTGADFVSAGSKKYAFGIVVCNDGGVFYYSSAKARPFLPTLFDARVDKYCAAPYNMDKYKAMVRTLSEMEHDYGIEWREMV